MSTFAASHQPSSRRPPDAIASKLAPVGSLEGSPASGKRRMPLMRQPGARVAVLTMSDDTWRRVHAVLAEPNTTLSRYASIAELVEGERADIVVTDRSVLTGGGMVLRRLRQRSLTCTLIVNGALDEADAGQLLDLGADDVIRTGDRLLAPRLRAAARRARTVNAGSRVAIGDIMFDRESRRVWCAGHEVKLTRTEESVLDCLFWYAPRAVSIDEITSFVWGGDGTRGRRNLVHVYMGYLRSKLHDSRQVVIRTVRGVGYEFAARVS